MNMKAKRGKRALRARQAGAMGIVALMFVIVVALFAMTQAASISASNMMDSARQSDSVEALFLAESGIERVGFYYINSGTPISPSTTPYECVIQHVGGAQEYPLGRGVWRVLEVFPTDFEGTALPVQRCRVRVQGEVTGTGVKRTLETIVATDADLISLSSLNPNFDNVPYAGPRTTDETVDFPPSVWDLPAPPFGGSIPYRRWDKSGGPDGSRTAFVRKTDSGNDIQTIGGAFTINAGDVVINIPSAGKILRLTFDYQVWFSGNSNSTAVMYFNPYLTFTDPITGTPYYAPANSGGAGGCGSAAFCATRTVPKPSDGGPALPKIDCGFTDTINYESGAGGPNYLTGNCTSPIPNPPTGNTYWQTDGSLIFTIGGPSRPADVGALSLRKLGFTLEAKSNGQANWIWLDNLRLSVPALDGGGPSKMWREVATP